MSLDDVIKPTDVCKEDQLLSLMEALNKSPSEELYQYVVSRFSLYQLEPSSGFMHTVITNGYTECMMKYHGVKK